MHALCTVAYLELLRYLGTCTLRYKSGYTAVDFELFGCCNSSQIIFFAQLLRSFTRAQTSFSRACALVGPGVATPLHVHEPS